MNKLLTYSILIGFILCSHLARGLPIHKNQGRTYFVSNNGNDKNQGSESKPFRTIGRVNQLKLKPGDAIYFKGSDVFPGTLALTLNGDKGNEILISSYGNGRAILFGGARKSMTLRGQHFKVSNIDARGSGRKNGNTTAGVHLIKANEVLIEDMTIEGFQKAGLRMYSCRNADVKKILARNNGFSGIFVTGSKISESGNILIQDCMAENNPGDPTNHENHSGNGILVHMSRNVTIDHCTATNNGWDMPRLGNGPIGIWAYNSDSVAIQYCIAYRNRTHKGAMDGGGFDLDGGVTNSVIQYCLSYENEGAGYGLFQYAGANLWYNNVVRYCISINDAVSTEGSGGIFVWNSSEDSVQLADCMIYNNLVYSTYAPAVQFEKRSLNKNFQFVNNIFIGKNRIVDGPSSGERFSGNVWWSAEGDLLFRQCGSFQEWCVETGQEMLNGRIIGRLVDPQLKGPLLTQLTDPYLLKTLIGYQLRDSSPLRNVGLDLKSMFNIQYGFRDFFDNPVPAGSGPEPGVHELN